MKLHRFGFGIGCLILATGLNCASGTEGADDASVRQDAAIESDAEPSDGSAEAVADSGGAPGAPSITKVNIVSHGVIDVAWTLPDSTCSFVEVMRKKDAAPYARVQKLVGTSTSVQDQLSHTNTAGVYCYTIVCTLGSASTPSNEKCVTHP